MAQRAHARAVVVVVSCGRRMDPAAVSPGLPQPPVISVEAMEAPELLWPAALEVAVAAARQTLGPMAQTAATLTKAALAAALGLASLRLTRWGILVARAAASGATTAGVVRAVTVPQEPLALAVKAVAVAGLPHLLRLGLEALAVSQAAAAAVVEPA